MALRTDLIAHFERERREAEGILEAIRNPSGYRLLDGATHQDITPQAEAGLQAAIDDFDVMLGDLRARL
jgi:hypothetical protein